MKFIFIRHAQAVHNSDAVARGNMAYFDQLNTDAPLDSVGLTQLLTNRQIFNCDGYYCSPLQRCYQTLLGVMPSSSTLEVRLDDRLMETQGRAFCNKRNGKPYVVASVPPTWDTIRVADSNPFDACREEYNTTISRMPEFCDRVRDFTEYLLTQHSIVSHHDWIRTWFYLYPKTDVSPTNCEVLNAELKVES